MLAGDSSVAPTCEVPSVIPSSSLTAVVMVTTSSSVSVESLVACGIFVISHNDGLVVSGTVICTGVGLVTLSFFTPSSSFSFSSFSFSSLSSANKKICKINKNKAKLTFILSRPFRHWVLFLNYFSRPFRYWVTWYGFFRYWVLFLIHWYGFFRYWVRYYWYGFFR